jgi:hypothetical protein
MLSNKTVRFWRRLFSESSKALGASKSVSNRILRFVDHKTRWSRLVHSGLRNQMRKQSLTLDAFQTVAGYAI